MNPRHFKVSGEWSREESQRNQDKVYQERQWSTVAM